MHTLLTHLWKLAEEEALQQNISPALAFDTIGLILEPFAVDFRYTSSPINTTTFASTGGDGVHFGFLHIDNRVMEKSPVVMTVPMAFNKSSLIVGRDLHQFLCLGSGISYFFLEQLLYDEEETIRWIESPSIPQRQNYSIPTDARYLEEQRLLGLLIKHFELHPWENVREELHRLQHEYGPLLILPSDEDGENQE